MTTHLQVPYKSIPDMFLHRVAETPDKKAFSSPGPNGPVWLNWRQVAERANLPKSTAHRLLNLLVEHGYIERVDARYRLSRADTDDVGQSVWLRLVDLLAFATDGGTCDCPAAAAPI